MNEIINRQKVRRNLNVDNDDFLLVSVGELSARKNHIVVLRALNQIRYSHPKMSDKFKYIIVGQGDLEKEYGEYIDSHGLNNNVKLLGYRSDISELLQASDLFVFPSLQEGLPVALMEAMASGIPTICSRIRVSPQK